MRLEDKDKLLMKNKQDKSASTVMAKLMPINRFQPIMKRNGKTSLICPDKNAAAPRRKVMCNY
jgi:hypothetical protein